MLYLLNGLKLVSLKEMWRVGFDTHKETVSLSVVFSSAHISPSFILAVTTNAEVRWHTLTLMSTGGTSSAKQMKLYMKACTAQEHGLRLFLVLWVSRMTTEFNHQTGNERMFGYHFSKFWEVGSKVWIGLEIENVRQLSKKRARRRRKARTIYYSWDKKFSLSAKLSPDECLAIRFVNFLDLEFIDQRSKLV